MYDGIVGWRNFEYTKQPDISFGLYLTVIYKRNVCTCVDMLYRSSSYNTIFALLCSILIYWKHGISSYLTECVYNIFYLDQISYIVVFLNIQIIICIFIHINLYINVYGFSELKMIKFNHLNVKKIIYISATFIFYS